MSDPSKSQATARSFRSDGGLLGAVRARTHSLHTTAEKSGIIHELLRGRARVPDYALLLRNLQPAYEVMESLLHGVDARAGFRTLTDNRLFRLPAIDADLRTMIGSGWRRELPILPEAEQYAERIRSAGTSDPLRLVGHAYTRYLGDLSGGRIIRRVLAKSLSLPDGALNFYQFDAINDIDGYKNEYLGALQNLTNDPSSIGVVAEEAATAFEHNIALSKAVLAEARKQIRRPTRLEA